MKYYKFKEELKEGVVLARPNRFIMEVLVDGKKELAHCPATGRIGNFDFKEDEIPCLLSESDNPKRKTRFTVEALSSQKKESLRKKWVGINQTKSNDYIAFFLENDFLPKLKKRKEGLEREKKLGNSRIDFRLGKNFIEVKTFIGIIPQGNRKDKLVITSLDRLIKHFSDLGDLAKKNQAKAVVLICNQYNAVPFSPPKNASESRVGKTVKKAVENGLENWQVNLKIDKKGVYFLDYFKLDFEID